jgi:hypothetical protein
MIIVFQIMPLGGQLHVCELGAPLKLAMVAKLIGQALIPCYPNRIDVSVGSGIDLPERLPTP